MTNTFFSKAVVISFLGHITLFGIFSFSFGPKVVELNSTNISFFGAVLRNSDLMDKHDLNNNIGNKKRNFSTKLEVSALDKVSRGSLLVSRDYSKPAFSLAYNESKAAFTPEGDKPSFNPARKTQAIMFYPNLPYDFALYFKDRQVVHIELKFRVTSGERRNSVLVKRNISSGNLEADLLSMRYISRYLFIEQRGYAFNEWQVVKIDLSTLK